MIEMVSITNENNAKRIDISRLPKGIYILQTKNNSQKILIK